MLSADTEPDTKKKKMGRSVPGAAAVASRGSATTRHTTLKVCEAPKGNGWGIVSEVYVVRRRMSFPLLWLFAIDSTIATG